VPKKGKNATKVYNNANHSGKFLHNNRRIYRNFYFAVQDPSQYNKNTKKTNPVKVISMNMLESKAKRKSSSLKNSVEKKKRKKIKNMRQVCDSWRI